METTETIGKWADETFGPGTVRSRSERLADEAEELLEEAYAEYIPDRAKIADEIADCAIVLATVAWTAGVNLQEAVDRKMAVNRARKWRRTTEGCGQHE